MVLKPSPILCPCVGDDAPSFLAHSLYGFRVAPAWDAGAKTDKMRAGMDGDPERKIIVHEPIAGREPLDQPQRCPDVLVQEKLVELCNHLPKIQGPHAQLTHLPINHKDRGLVLGLEIPIGKQNTAADISALRVSRVLERAIAYFPVQKSPWMTCSLLSSSSSSFALAMTSLNTSSDSLRNGKSSDCQKRLS